MGITAFEMAESEHPFFNLNPMTAMFQIVSDPVPKLSNLTAVTKRIYEKGKMIEKKEKGGKERKGKERVEG